MGVFWSHSSERINLLEGVFSTPWQGCVRDSPVRCRLSTVAHGPRGVFIRYQRGLIGP